MKECLAWEVPPIAVVGEEGDLVELSVGRHRFFWPRELAWKDLAWMYNEVFLAPATNPHAYELGDVRIDPAKWVIDAGACEGFFGFYALERGARVILVEPVERLCVALRRTFHREIAAERLAVVHAALSDRDGVVGLQMSAEKAYEACAGGGGVAVPAVKLDSLVRELRLSDVGFLKMDVEGGEMSALAGGAETLQRMRPTLSVAVYHDLLNGVLCESIARFFYNGYRTSFRGRYDWDGCEPRPFMMHAVAS
jgi:FkbM family methyltransferase